MVSQVRSGSWWINLSVEIVHNVLRAYRSHPLYAHSWFNALYPAIAIHSIFELDHIHNTIVFKYMLWKKSISPVFCVDFIHFIHMLSSIHCQVSWTTWWLTCKFTHYKVFCFYKKKKHNHVFALCGHVIQYILIFKRYGIPFTKRDLSTQLTYRLSIFITTPKIVCALPTSLHTFLKYWALRVTYIVHVTFL